ncbi:hypothetical protein L207DRAFT_520346 [Hyaloscypha variabilis F]|uniref:Uncharacterized protein n=1 Tax=Hyaloscypha variabilis (strain UAMH 11265 / GT02V1 / F) TaxID=1149755 RepID=A0A2J6QVD4_HYAVF|nr:hypothetical protein L207DRAFT_520346 [Hyaloscypha variabilis F]
MEHWNDITSKGSTYTQVITSSLRLPTSTSRSRKAIFLFGVIKHSDQRAVEFLLSLGADKNHPHNSVSEETTTTCYELSYKCYSSLGYAVSQGRREICQLFLSKGAAINGKGGNIEPPLNVAIRRPRGTLLIALLLEAGADVNYAFKRVRPLALAIDQGENGMVQCLLRSGAEMQKSFVREVWMTPWHGEKWMTPVQQAKGMPDFERTLKQWKRGGKRGVF